VSAAYNQAFDEALQQTVNNSATTLNNGQPVRTGFQVLEATNPTFAYATKTTVQTLASRPLRALIGALLGLVLGLLIALVRALLDKRLNTVRRAEVAVGYPVVAQIPASASGSGDPGEAYRMLWLSIFEDPLPQPSEQGADEWLDEVDLRADAGSWRELDS
jgi:ABC-type amino acid transport system permease subunit